MLIMKNSLFFSTNVKDDDKNHVFQALNVHCSTNLERYLRLPNWMGRKKNGFERSTEVENQ